MPYESINDLPDSVRHVLPKHGQDIYKEAFNSAYEEYKSPDERKRDDDREVVSHRVAWSAVKHRYRKDTDDKWHPMD